MFSKLPIRQVTHDFPDSSIRSLSKLPIRQVTDDTKANNLR